MAVYAKITDLPLVLPVFPLPGCVLFPRWELNLNIFEPRYLNMIDDAMRASRLIGMIQTIDGPRVHPGLAGVGCAGRITSYAETSDGRYLITLTGICRFAVAREIEAQTPYRQVEPDWAAFQMDLAAPAETDPDIRHRLSEAFKAYAQHHGIQADWTAMQAASLETLVHALAAGCPFSHAEKQALLEARRLEERARALIALLEFGSAPGATGNVQ